MNRRSTTLSSLVCTICFVIAGCNAPGRPVQAEAARPDDMVDFSTLYKQNCAACHGQDGKNGATISLANPVYVATAGVGNIERITAAGVPDTAMPPFARSAGGMLTDRQVAVIAKGIVDAWGHSNAITGQLPPYSGTGDSAKGQTSYATFCARCHGADGAGMSSGGTKIGSIVDPAYLALVSDQYLRSTIIAGRSKQGMPDWRSDLTGPNARPMTDQEISDITAWIASHRIATPGEPYPQHP